MKLKYFQELANIKRHYEDIERNYATKFGASLLESWGINRDNPAERAQIKRELDAITYLVYCENELARGKDAVKPDVQDLTAAFARYLAFLNGVMDVNVDNWRDAGTVSQNEYKTCMLYADKLACSTWWNKLPERILTFENKYPKN